MANETLPWEDPIVAPLLVLWLYLPGYLSNTAAMLGGKWIPDLTGMPVFPIDGGKVLGDGNRALGDGKTWNGLLGGTIGGGMLSTRRLSLILWASTQSILILFQMDGSISEEK